MFVCTDNITLGHCTRWILHYISFFHYYYMVVVVLRSPIHANEPSEYNGMLYRTSNRVLNNGIKVIILICMDGTSQYHHHLLYNSLAKRHAAIAERAHGKETWRRSGVLKNLRAKVYGVSPPETPDATLQ